MPTAPLSAEHLARLLAPPGDGAAPPSDLPTDGERWFRAIFEQTSAGISLTDASGRFVGCNPAFAATVGRTVHEVIGLTPADLTHPDDWADQRHLFEAARAGGPGQYAVAKRYVRPDGSAVWTEQSFTAIRSAGGQYQYGLGVTVDVTDRTRAEDAARRSVELFRLVWEGSSDGMRLTDADGLVKAVNSAYCRMTGRPAGELVGRVMTAAFAPHEQAGVLAKYARRFAARDVRRMGLSEVTLWDGRRRWFEVGDAYLDLPGEPTLLLTVFRDATDRRRAEERLRESEERFRAAMEGGLDAVYFLAAERDDHGTVTDFRFTDLNRRGAVLISRAREEVIGQRLCELLPVNRTGGFFDKYVRVVETGELLEEEFPIAADGINAAWLHYKVVRVGDGVAITTQDVTDRKRAEEELRQNQRRLVESQQELERANARLRRLAATDGLTGVNNRAAFDTRLGEEFDRAVRYDHPLSVVMLDVDQFKGFNDTFGHPAGDAVLRAVADQLADAVRGADFLARYGGEEFAVVLPDTDSTGAMAVGERLRRAVAEGAWDRRAITVSVGVATLSPDTPDADALVQEADQALYRSKQAGRNRVHHGRHATPQMAATRV